MFPKLLLAAALVALVMVVGTADAQTGTAESRMAARLAEELIVQPAANRILRRRLQQRDRYITYEALRADSIPCGWKGNSYYDCSFRIRANPYTRGCTEATRCFRYTH